MSQLRKALDALMSAPTTLEELIAKAETYGKVTIFGSSETPRNYRVHIDFYTITGTELGAKSDFGLKLKPALEQAIERAALIRSQFK